MPSAAAANSSPRASSAATATRCSTGISAPRAAARWTSSAATSALNELVFVEVKTRSRAGEFGRPSDAVNRDKQRLIARGAMAWLRMLDDPGIVYRFDIVEIVFEAGLPQITVMKDAFQLPEPWRW